MAMLVRRGFRPEQTALDLPFPQTLDGETAERLAGQLGHYGFRLFMRGAIREGARFRAPETTRYLKPDQTKRHAEFLVDLGLAERLPDDCYGLVWRAASFGDTLQWYVARELRRRLGFDVATGVKMHVPGVGGDLDVVAAAEGKLIYLELKSSPPKNLSVAEIGPFFDRVSLLQPDVALFVVDTALRLEDKILPMLEDELCRRRGGPACAPQPVTSQWRALTPHLYAVSARRDLMTNIGSCIAAGLRALSPRL